MTMRDDDEDDETLVHSLGRFAAVVLKVSWDWMLKEVSRIDLPFEDLASLLDGCPSGLV